MPALFTQIVGWLEFLADAAGVIAVAVALVTGLAPYIRTILGLRPPPSIPEVRSTLGRGLVLSLEIFIAADLFRTILAPTLLDVTVLALTTLIRIALSISLEWELGHLRPDGEGSER